MTALYPAHYTTVELRIENSTIGGTNPAILSFSSGDTLTISDVKKMTMQCVAFVSRCSMAVGSRVVSATYRTDAMAGSAPVPFDAIFWALLATNDPALPAMVNYGYDTGAGALLPLGNSCLALERTALPGRSYTGRTNIPYLPLGAIDSGGNVSNGVRAAVDQMYGWYILGDGGNIDAVPFNAGVLSTKLGIITPITLPQTQAKPSRLRSRQR
jgi:hypothetical protein